MKDKGLPGGMRSNWRKQMMISALALTLQQMWHPVFASTAPDSQDKCGRHCTDNGNNGPSGIVGRKNGNFKKMTGHISLSPRKQCLGVEFLHGIHQRR